MKGWGRRLAALPIAGIVVTLMALLALWNDNINRLPFESAWPTLAVGAAMAVVIVILLRPIAGSWTRAGLISGLVALYIFYVPAIVRQLSLPRGAEIAIHLLVIALLLVISRKIPRDEAKLVSIGGKLNLLCAVLLVVTLAPLLAVQWTSAGPRGRAANALGDFEGRASKSSPDVWHILFDRYAGLDTFQSTYGYDNHPFIEALRKRGFTVKDEAFGNYQRTGHSVASTMNGSLLDPLVEPMRERPNDWVPIYRHMRNGAAIRFFASQGYHTIFAGSWWEPTRFSDQADESIMIRAVPQLARLAIERSSIGFWLGSAAIPYLDGRGDQCFRANEKFRRLKALAGNKQQKYVFAHFLVPHPPFVLNADGSCRSIETARKSSRRDNYLGQVQFANREALALIDAIIAGPRPAVIVLHSDEGPWPAPYVGDEHGLGTDPVQVPWAKLPPQKLREKMSILLAVREPGGQPATMPASPVQIYPAILRDYFGSTRRLPESRQFIFEGDAELYRFHDVSKKLTQH